MAADLGSTARTTLHRLPDKAAGSRAALYRVLDDGVVAHVAIVAANQPFVLPCGYARDGDRLLLHGSTASRLFRSLAAGVPVCVSVTLLDGLVFARSMFESSMHYRSAMVLGRARRVSDADKPEALRRLSEHLMPGRWADARPPSRRELGATMVVAIGLGEASVKIGEGPPDDAEEDLGWPAWAGTLPLRTVSGPPYDAEGLPAGAARPGYLTARFPAGSW